MRIQQLCAMLDEALLKPEDGASSRLLHGSSSSSAMQSLFKAALGIGPCSFFGIGGPRRPLLRFVGGSCNRSMAALSLSALSAWCWCALPCT